MARTQSFNRAHSRDGATWGRANAMRCLIGMSLILMIAMAFAMNLTHDLLTAQTTLSRCVLPVILLAAFLTPLPCSDWRLKAPSKACCH